MRDYFTKTIWEKRVCGACGVGGGGGWRVERINHFIFPVHMIWEGARTSGRPEVGEGYWVNRVRGASWGGKVQWGGEGKVAWAKCAIGEQWGGGD